MPVILRRDREELWLDPEVQDAALLGQCLRSYPAEEMEGYPVGAAVSSPRNNGAELVQPRAGP